MGCRDRLLGVKVVQVREWGAKSWVPREWRVGLEVEGLDVWEDGDGGWRLK